MKRLSLIALIFLGLGAWAQRPVATRLDTNEHPIIGSAVSATSLTINGTAAAIPSSALAGRMTLIIFNNGTESLYLGGSGVTTNNGLPIDAGSSFTIDVNDSIDIYGISNGTNLDVRAFEG